MDLYHMYGSPPCRAIELLGKTLDLKFNIKNVDFLKSEHLSPEFLKLNPMHQVPVVNDNGFILTESRAIAQYLVNAYGKEKKESLYSSDAKKRFLVDRLLNFDLILYASFGDLYYPMIFVKAKLDQEKFKKLNENLGFLEGFLSGGLYAAGDAITLADFVLMASLSCMETIHDMKSFPRISAYMTRCKETMVGYKDVGGVQEFREWAQAIVDARE